MDDREKKIGLEDDDFDEYELQELINKGKMQRLLICITALAVLAISIIVFGTTTQYYCHKYTKESDYSSLSFTSITEEIRCTFEWK